MFDKNNYGGMLSWINTIFPIIPYHNRINNLVDEDYSNFMVYKGHSVSKGFLPVYTVKPCENVEYMDKELDGYSSIPKVADKYYTKMNKLCEENKSKLIILQLPAYTAWNNKRHEATKEYAGKKNIEFVDLNSENDEVGIDYKVDTYDKGEHLNYSGAKKVTKYIGDYIDKKHKLKDHRKEKGYEKWEEDLEKYKEKTEKMEKDFYNNINKKDNKNDENKKERLSKKHKTR